MPSNPSKDYYYILRETPNTEAVIVEYGFLDNKNDAERLKNNYKDYADAVIDAIIDYKGLNIQEQNEPNGVYIVKKGDTLWTIAKNYNLTVDKLKDINNLTNNSLSIGQILKVTDNDKKPTDDDDNNNLIDYYVVQSGDTLYSISKKTGISIDEIKNINNLNTNTLSIGQKLYLKDNYDENTIYVVKAGDNLYKIANIYGVSVEDIKKQNNLKTNLLSIGQQLLIPTKQDYKVYTVKKGDTLYSIALSNNTSVNNIKALNNLSTNILSIGQKLLLP